MRRSKIDPKTGFAFPPSLRFQFFGSQCSASLLASALRPLAPRSRGISHPEALDHADRFRLLRGTLGRAASLDTNGPTAVESTLGIPSAKPVDLPAVLRGQGGILAGPEPVESVMPQVAAGTEVEASRADATRDTTVRHAETDGLRLVRDDVHGHGAGGGLVVAEEADAAGAGGDEEGFGFGLVLDLPDVGGGVGVADLACLELVDVEDAEGLLGEEQGLAGGFLTFSEGGGRDEAQGGGEEGGEDGGGVHLAGCLWVCYCLCRFEGGGWDLDRLNWKCLNSLWRLGLMSMGVDERNLSKRQINLTRSYILSVMAELRMERTFDVPECPDATSDKLKTKLAISDLGADLRSELLIRWFQDVLKRASTNRTCRRTPTSSSVVSVVSASGRK